ncbi:MAG: SMI1/KNR4 family protein [Myxococcota bacterium]
MFDETYSGKLGEPATEDAVAAAEAKLGIAMPKDLREFLLNHNGWTEFDGDGKLLSTADFGAEWVSKTAAEWSDIWESDDPKPFEKGGVPIMLGEDVENFLVLVPSITNADGEPVFELYDSMEKEETFQTFGDYLRRQHNTLLEMIREEE